VSFVNDAIKFIAVFGPPISQSTPHIYLSALPFAPKNSLVAKHYMPLFPKVLHLKTGKADQWPPIIDVFEGHTNSVNSIAFSQDGKRIVSGSYDQTIRVWDAETGEVVVGPLEGHTNSVKSVAFSQDGKRIVSGSRDHTIRVWDAETGEVVVGPLEGHTNSVNSVAFSQDGKHIVSGSDDQTIRVWDAETGEVVIGPLEGHTDSVNSVTFSQDARCVISCSDDHTIHICSVLENNLANLFTDTSTLVGGWIHNPSSKPLFWVPSWNRPGLCWPRNLLVIALNSPSTHLDLDNFVHGDSWQQCNTEL